MCLCRDVQVKNFLVSFFHIQLQIYYNCNKNPLSSFLIGFQPLSIRIQATQTLVHSQIYKFVMKNKSHTICFFTTNQIWQASIAFILIPWSQRFSFATKRRDKKGKEAPRQERERSGERKPLVAGDANLTIVLR